MTTIDMTELRRMACEMSGVNRWGVARVTSDGAIEVYSCENAKEAYRVDKPIESCVVALNGAVMYAKEADAPTTHDPAESPELAPLAALSDADLKARYDASWALVLAYGEEIRRRAGEVVQSKLIPF